MTAVEARRVVPIDAPTAFALAHELGEDRAAWDADTVASRLIRGAAEPGEGVSRFERSRSGRRIMLRTTLWSPPLASAASMTKGPAWLREYGESVRVEPLEGGRSTVTWKIVARPLAPLFPGAVGGAAEPWLRALLERRMDGFAAAAERLANGDERR